MAMDIAFALNQTQTKFALEIIEAFRLTGDDSPMRIVATGQAIFEELELQKFTPGDAVLMHFDPSPIADDDDFARSALTVALAKCAGIGTPFGVQEENDALFQTIAPKAEAAANTNATAGEFRFHSDNSAVNENVRGEWISLTCVHNDAHAATGIVSAETLYKNLPSALQVVAKQIRFQHVVPPSFGVDCAGTSEPRAIFSIKPDGIYIAATTYRTEPVIQNDTLASLTVETIEKVAQAQADWIDLQPGQVLFFRNDKHLHARRAIEGTRKLLRAYWKQHSLAELRLLASTTCPYMFSAKKALMAWGVAK